MGLEYVLLLLLGVGVGAFGTLIGAGGGFILMPVLLLWHPDAPPAGLTAISLGVVFFNATSGSISYARMKRIDYTSGLLFLLPGVPGALAGAYVVRFIPRDVFSLIFGALLLAGGLVILLRSFATPRPRLAPKGAFMRLIIDADGTRHVFGYSLPVGMGLSFAVGVTATVFGIGGGILHVPAMVNLLSFPVHLATATSQFILAVMALTGTVVHVIDGTLGLAELPSLLALAVGAAGGAQLGAMLSRRLHGRWILRALAIALALVGVRVLVLGVQAILAGA